MGTKVLCVDDDPKILAGYQRALGGRFAIETASDAEEGLTLLESQGPYAVVVADMHMPGMNGVQFLRRAMEKAPEAVRIMLTGSSEQDTTIAAVNHGHVFQFLTKPCPAKVLAEALELGIKQYHQNLHLHSTLAPPTAKRQPPEAFLHNYGKKQFDALVGFIDICRFSEAARGKSAAQVRDLVAPFIQTVVRTAEEHQCYIDKTIGDEVMVVMPCVDGVELRAQSPQKAAGWAGLESIRFPDVSRFLLELIERLHGVAPDLSFAAGFAYGRVLLDQVGTDSYKEWTVYGNCINAAKRLQSMPHLEMTVQGEGVRHRVALGAIEADYPEFDHLLRYGLETAFPETALRLQDPVISIERFKGVGRIWYLSAGL